MKKISLLFVFSLITAFAVGQSYNWTAAATGNWTAAATWTVDPAAPAGQTFPKTTDDIVVIKNYNVTTDFEDENNEVIVQSVEIDNALGIFGTLTIRPTDTVATTGELVIKEGDYNGWSRILMNGGGGLRIGSSLTIDGLITTSGNSKIDVGSFYKHNTGKVSFSGDMELDITTAGAIPSGINEHNFFIGSNAEYVFGTGTVNLLIDIFNGNLGTKEEIYLEDAKVTNNSSGGFIITLITNTDGTDNNYAMKVDMGLGQVGVDIGSATITYDNVTPAKNVMFRELYLFSGHFDMQSGSLLEIEPTATFF